MKMNETDLDRYKSAWKNDAGFNSIKLDEADIQKFMHSASKDISSQFRNGIRIDIVLKSVLAFSFAATGILMSGEPGMLIVSALLAITAGTGIVFQLTIYNRIPGNKADKNMLTLLKEYTGFYSEKYIKSLLVASLTGPLIFISGSLLYLFFKYGGLRPFDIVDYLVFGIFILTSFIISAFGQLQNFSSQIRQLEICLEEIERETLKGDSLNMYKKSRLRRVLIMGIILIIGILLLLLLIFNLSN